MMKRLLSVLCLTLFIPVAWAESSTWRCGRNLVSTDDSAGEVMRKCGPPLDRVFIGYREASAYYGGAQIPIEEWVYRGSGGMYQYLRFQGNRLIQIQSRRGD